MFLQQFYNITEFSEGQDNDTETCCYSHSINCPIIKSERTSQTFSLKNWVPEIGTHLIVQTFLDSVGRCPRHPCGSNN